MMVPFPHIQNLQYIGILPCLLVVQLLLQTISHRQHPNQYPSNRLHLHHITLLEFHPYLNVSLETMKTLESCVCPSLPEDEEQTTIININFGPEDHQISNLQTYAKAVAKVIGRSEDVLKLDTIWVQMKSNSSCCSTMSEEHDRETQQNRGSWETILLSGQAHT